jgi:hypothetical protein
MWEFEPNASQLQSASLTVILMMSCFNRDSVLSNLIVSNTSNPSWLGNHCPAPLQTDWWCERALSLSLSLSLCPLQDCTKYKIFVMSHCFFGVQLVWPSVKFLDWAVTSFRHHCRAAPEVEAYTTKLRYSFKTSLKILPFWRLAVKLLHFSFWSPDA